MGLFSETIARQLGGFLGKFLECDSKSLSLGVRTILRIRVQLDVRKPLKRRKKIVFAYGNHTYVSFKYEKLTLFCFYCGHLGYGDSFCHIRMLREEESIKLGWDLSFQAQSRRATAMFNVWLVESRDEGGLGSIVEKRGFGYEAEVDDRRGVGFKVDPMLGLNLEGNGSKVLDMDHDG
ncbi:hypothetical protein Gogos_010552 [Gossypium gossypioides]|uniref:Zinc knuckle CX2CX4HX4C domain-containing protein n=1 Tax=Gossypium gossypioides TaxID=34282 RepID=A0A7J9BLJ2_GOSGO|nr:hypothetical protein [Gossypium gossypioides]